MTEGSGYLQPATRWISSFQTPFSEVRRRSDRVLLQIQDRSGNALTLIAGKIESSERDVSRDQQPAERPGPCRFFEPIVTFALFLCLNAVLVWSIRPTDVELVDSNPVAVEIAGVVLRQGHERALCSRVSHQLRFTDVGIDRTDIDDCSSALSLHVFYRLLHADEGAAHIGCEEAIP